MLVSIVTPTFNDEKYILTSIHSVQSQSYENWELIVIDDGSHDNTRNIVSGLALNDKRIKLFSLKENGGSAVARNVGLELARGEYLAFLDADDVWFEDKLEKQIAFMVCKDALFSYTAYEIMNENGERSGKFIDFQGIDRVGYVDMLKKKATLGCSTVMLNWNKLSKFRMPLIRTGQDYALWLSILKEGHVAFCLRDVLTMYRIVPGSISRNKFKKALRQWEIYRKIERIPTIKSFWFFLNYAYRAISR